MILEGENVQKFVFRCEEDLECEYEVDNKNRKLVIGSGGFGDVYAARVVVAGQGDRVVVKEILEEKLKAKKIDVTRVREEAKLHSKLSHSNIVQYIGSLSLGGVIKIVMEHVSDGDLSSLLQSNRINFEEDVVLLTHYAKQMLRGLNYLHEDAKTVHRDIKGGNLLVNLGRHELKISDFGLSRVLSSSRIQSGATSKCVGTQYFMAPEVINGGGRGYGSPADIWSAACTIIEMITGHHPYKDMDWPSWTVIFQVGFYKVHPTIPQGVDPNLKQILLDSFNKEPRNRPSCAKLLEHPLFRGSLGPANHMMEFSTATFKNYDPLQPADVKPTPQDLPIWFDIQPTLEIFCGRETFIQKLHTDLHQPSSGHPTVTSRIRIVSGPGGIGKTETFLKYIDKYSHTYHHIIWLNAETENSLQTSFLNLLAENEEKLGISIRTGDGRPKEMKSIVKQIFDKLCSKQTLLIFDNAECYNGGIKPFLPGQLPRGLEYPYVLVTSRNSDWPALVNNVVELGTFSEEESVKFVLGQLQLKDNPTNRTEATTLADLLGHLPLALHQSIAYMKENRLNFDVNPSLPTSSPILDYIEDFKKESSQLLEYKIEDSPYNQTVATTWRTTFEKIASAGPPGQMAIKYIELFSFLSPDGIPSKLLTALTPNFDSRALNKALILLQKYALIKITGDDRQLTILIHRLVQQVIVDSLKKSGRFSSLLERTFQPCLTFCKNLPLSDNNLKIFLNNALSLSLLSDTLSSNPAAQNFKFGLAHKVREIGDYEMAQKLFMQAHATALARLGPNDAQTLEIEYEIASTFWAMGRNAESLQILRPLFEKQVLVLRKEHPQTIRTLHKTAGVLLAQGKYEEALSVYEEVYPLRQKSQGTENNETLQTLYNKAVCLSYMGKDRESLEIRRQVDQIRSLTMGEDHLDVMASRTGMGFLMGKIGELDQAWEILEENARRLKINLGSKHPATMENMFQQAVVLHRQRRFSEANEMFGKVHEMRRKVLGAEHPFTLRTLHCWALMLKDEGRRDESLRMSRHVYECRKRVLGVDHPDSKCTLSNISALSAEEEGEEEEWDLIG